MTEQEANDMLRLIETVKYLAGIAEKGDGRQQREDETTEQFVLGYVKRLESLTRVANCGTADSFIACDGCKRLKVWAESAWARGHAMGMQENTRIAREATAALEAEKEAHAETNVRLTEALMMAEEELARMQANAQVTGASPALMAKRPR